MSTRAEEIAAVKRVIEECEVNGYDNFPDDPHTFGHLTSMRAVLATLEGMAAPGENERAMEVIRRAAALIEKRDSPSPQQPTPEALSAYDDLIDDQRKLRSVHREVGALAMERFAAQRVTAAPVSEDVRQVIAKAISPQRWANLNAGEESSVLAEAERLLDAALTAATDKARREAIEECLRLCCLKQSCGDRIRALTSGIKCAIYSQTPPYRMRCEKCLAAGRCLEALTPQNPGDVTPHQEGEK